MKFGICLLSVVAVRSESNDRSEMTTQLLFGDLVVVNEVLGNWLHIRNVFDNYEGWVDFRQVAEIGEHEFQRLSKATPRYTKDLIEILHDESGRIIPVVFGSTIRDTKDNRFEIDGRFYSFTGMLSPCDVNPVVNSIIEDAMIFMNAPYFWGGKTPFGIDCSGLTQMALKTNGIQLLRDAAQQATQGETISLIDEAIPGDLAFFDDPEGKIIHVGMFVKKDKILHASGQVRIDSIDHHGIFNKELQKYTHQLRIIKRLI